jgi:hypothetical protein
MYGTLGGALAGRKIAVERESFTARVEGRISGIGKTIRIKSIHVHYDLAVPAEAREATERALRVHIERLAPGPRLEPGGVPAGAGGEPGDGVAGVRADQHEEAGAVGVETAERRALVALEIGQTLPRQPVIERRAFHQRALHAGIERRGCQRLQELGEDARVARGEEPGLLEDVVVQHPLELREIGDAIEDVGGRAVGLGTAGHHAALGAQRGELREMRGAVGQAALVVVRRAGEADVHDHATVLA